MTGRGLGALRAQVRSLLVRFARDTRGVSAIVVGLSLSAILGAAGLAVDVGIWYTDQRAAQGAADSASYSAAVDYAKNSSTTNAEATAQAVATSFGFSNNVGGVSVVVNSPPTSGSHTASSNAFEVIITKPESLFFSSFYLSAASVRARSVAVPAATAVGQYCMEILNATPGASNVNFNISNGASIDLSQCGISDNGPGSCAISASGGASIITKSLSVVGNYCTSNGATVTVSGAKTTGAQATPNPYSSLSVSTVEGSTNMTCPNSTATNYASGGQKYNISPGVFCGGLSVSNGVTVTMAPGVYYVVGGTFSLQGGTTTNASGVTIVLTGSGSNYATANIANGATLNLTAPTTGATAGVALWADGAGPTTNTSTIAGGSSMLINGAMYLPTQTVSFSNGTSNSSACTQLVAYNVTFQGGAKFSNTCANSGITPIGGSSSQTQVVE
jgi:Flp pilus assembly protein TadG